MLGKIYYDQLLKIILCIFISKSNYCKKNLDSKWNRNKIEKESYLLRTVHYNDTAVFLKRKS